MPVSRWAKLGELTSRLAGDAVAESMANALRSPVERLRAAKQAQQRRAEKLVAGLSRLKGAAMKMGQQAALLASNLDLPPEVQEQLSKLHDKAEPVSWETIRSALEAELGDALEAFATIDESPLGTASLAQAHAATLHDGSQVVVKVLHHGIDESVEADLLAMKALMSAGRLVGRGRAETSGLFEELAEKLHEELDYTLEAANLTEFHERFGNDERFRIPKVHPDLSTNRVLTMDRIVGKPIGEFLEDASPEARARAGRNLADLFFESAFRHRVLHADPHPGNFLFEPDGRVGVLDFGCVKRFEASWIGRYAKLVMAAVDDDREAILAETRALGAWEGEDPRAAEVIVDFCEAVMGPLRNGPYTIGSEDHLLERVKPVVERMWGFTEIKGPRHLLFLHRTLGGLYSMMRQLEVTEDWPPRMRPHLEAAAEAA